jgi:hypothetical protein
MEDYLLKNGGFFLGRDWGLNSGLPTCKAGALCLGHTSIPLCSGYLGNGGLSNYLSGLTLNQNLALSSSWDYRCEPLVTGLK